MQRFVDAFGEPGSRDAVGSMQVEKAVNDVEGLRRCQKFPGCPDMSALRRRREEVQVQGLRLPHRMGIRICSDRADEFLCREQVNLWPKVELYVDRVADDVARNTGKPI